MSKGVDKFREICSEYLQLYILIAQMGSGSSGVAQIWNPAASSFHHHDDDAEI